MADLSGGDGGRHSAGDRDPGRRDWYCIMPERNYADPKASAEMPA